VNRHAERIARELALRGAQVEATAALLADGATVPFIARYRKEATGALDEVKVLAIRDRLGQLAVLDQRRGAILKSLQERELLTGTLEQALAHAGTLAELEDLYLPYRPKRRTRGELAREKGLEPLAVALLRQDGLDPCREAQRFLCPDKGVATVDDALAGARDIMAERFSEDAGLRQRLRQLFAKAGVLSSTVVKGKDEEGQKYRDYFAWQEPASRAPSHRVLAMCRGEEQGLLRLSLRPPEDQALALLKNSVLRTTTPAAEQAALALQDGYKRLLAPSLETERRREIRDSAEAEAIRVFAENVRELLMAPPLGRKAVLALDPGLRTGCKTVCLGPQGDLLHHTVIFPHEPKQREAAAQTVRELCARFHIAAAAVGNGTAGRETEQFLRDVGLDSAIAIVMVNESGASIYSASEVAREEFPDLDLTVRGAVSIGRRLMDPLAELVKLDPNCIGVGQYQHDVDQAQLRRALDDVVSCCVNAVGVDVNTASRQLLTHVSGLGPVLAGQIVAFRNEHGAFRARAELRQVPRLGPKAFQQAAGFLRIPGAANPLDASAVHPESYAVVARMARDLNATVSELLVNAEARARLDLPRYVTADIGLPTLTDIVAELAKPGRDPRREFEVFRFADSVHAINDLAPGMRLPGIVTNVTRFGAFVDIGVHQDGLVHISQLADRFVKDPAEVVRVQQPVQVTVLEVDLPRRRIALSMRANPTPAAQPPPA